MNKCHKCGCEFEGNFCPECGANCTDEITCPNCGRKSKAGTKFCTECGSALDGGSGGLKLNEKQAGIIRKILYFAPAALFGLLAALLWAFYAAPVLKIDSFDLKYNAYEATGDYAAANALIAFAVIAVVLAVFAALVLFIPKLGSISFKIKNFEINLNAVCICLEWVVLFCLFVTGAVVSGDYAEYGDVCGGLVLAFSLIFLILSVGACVADFVLKKLSPTYREAKDK